MPQPVSVVEAAREFHVTRQTVGRWIRRGAPCVELGAVGRGRGSLVSVAALQSWRRGGPAAAQVGIDPALLAIGLWRAYARPAEGEIDSTWKIAGVERRAAALILVGAYCETIRVATGCYPTSFPREMELLRSISLQSVDRGKPAAADDEGPRT